MNKTVAMILTNGFDPDPRVYKEAVYLTDRGMHVSIICWDRDLSKGHEDIEKVDGIDIIRFKIPSVAGSGYRQIPAFIRYIKMCKKHFENNSYDYIHCHDLDGAMVGYLVAKHHSKRIFDMHEFYENGNQLKRFIFRKMTVFLLQKSYAGIRVNDAYCNKNYQSVINKVVLLKNLPDSKLIQRKEKKQSEFLRIGYYGDIRCQVLEFKSLFEAVKDLGGVLVQVRGGGPDWIAVNELSKQYNNVTVGGIFDARTELTDLYANTDIVYCAYDPSVPNYQGDTEAVKFFEAIYTETPIIATKDIGMGKKVEKFGYGIACDTRDSDQIREAILKFENSPGFWEKCSGNEKQQAKNYDWNEAVKVLDAIYLPEKEV